MPIRNRGFWRSQARLIERIFEPWRSLFTRRSREQDKQTECSIRRKRRRRKGKGHE